MTDGTRQIQDFRDVIACFDGARPMARRLGLNPNSVLKWHVRGSIPYEYWDEICAHAAEHRLPITPELLVKIGRRNKAAA